LITLRTFECAPVVIGFVWLDATKPRAPHFGHFSKLRANRAESKTVEAGMEALHADYRRIAYSVPVLCLSAAYSN
jgi:hypothetical protein